MAAMVDNLIKLCTKYTFTQAIWVSRQCGLQANAFYEITEGH
jgi:hypothetical protein